MCWLLCLLLSYWLSIDLFWPWGTEVYTRPVFRGVHSDRCWFEIARYQQGVYISVYWRMLCIVIYIRICTFNIYTHNITTTIDIYIYIYPTYIYTLLLKLYIYLHAYTLTTHTYSDHRSTYIYKHSNNIPTIYTHTHIL